MANIKEFSQVVEDTENEGRFLAPKIFIADTVDDISYLPGTDKIAWGSFAICLSTGEVYVLRQSGQWGLFGETEG